MDRAAYARLLRKFPLTLLIYSLFMAGATSAHANITGSAHDFSGQGWGTDEICIFCHTPHNAKTPQLAPLWNHTSTTATYTLYDSPTMDEKTVQPRGPSKVCLSCHDGTVAIDSFGNRGGSHFITGNANLGTNLANDHPVSVPWTHQTFNPSGGSPPCANCHSFHGPLAYNLPFNGSHSAYLECGTCHEPHDKYPAYSSGKMLRKELAGSAICLHCHGK